MAIISTNVYRIEAEGAVGYNRRTAISALHRVARITVEDAIGHRGTAGVLDDDSPAIDSRIACKETVRHRHAAEIAVYPGAIVGAISSEQAVGDGWAAAADGDRPTERIRRIDLEGTVGYGRTAAKNKHSPTPVVRVSSIGISSGNSKTRQNRRQRFATDALDDVQGTAAVDGGVIGISTGAADGNGFPV